MSAVGTATGEAGGRAASRIGTWLLLTLGLLSAVSPFATDLYLPAFPQMVSELSTTETGVQLSLTAFLIGIGVGQMVFGPLSDRVGRRGPLLAGMIIYLAASVAAALAPSIGLLIAFRLLQGLAGASGVVIARAIISDTARGVAAARAFSLMQLVLGVAPILAPFAGSLLAAPIGWRGLLWIVAALGALSVIAIALVVKETRTRSAEAAERALGGRGLARELGSRVYVGNALAYGFGFATMMAYISASPFLYQDLMGLSTIQYGLAFAVNALGLMAATIVTARLVGRIGARRLARLGLAINLAAILALGLLVLAAAPAIWLAVPIFFAVAALGMSMGNTTALALDAVPQAPGLGSAFLGLLQFALAGIVSPLVSIGGGTTTAPLVIVMLVASLVANGALLFAAPSTPRSAGRRAAR